MPMENLDPGPLAKMVDEVEAVLNMEQVEITVWGN